MFLSNPRPFFLAAVSLALLFQACGSSGANENKPISLTENTKSKFLFTTKEPEVYQGEFVVNNGSSEEHYFLARKGDKWRFDIIRNGARWGTELHADKTYRIDHLKQTYTVEHANGSEPAYFNSLTEGFFGGANHLEFEEIGRGGGQIKYRAKNLKDPKGDVLITIDEATGIMVRQEITGQKDQIAQGSLVNYIYEVRDLKVDVDDSIFEVPPGYRQMTR